MKKIRKFLLIVSALFCVFIIVSCGVITDSTQSDKNTGNTLIKDNITQEEKKDSLKIVKKKMEALTIDIPQFYDMKNSKRENHRNQLIEGLVEEEIKSTGVEELKDIAEIDMNILRHDEKILSVIYEASYYISTMAHPFNFAFTVNVNLLNDKKIDFSDAIAISEDFCEELRNGELTIDNAVSKYRSNLYPKEYLKRYSKSEIMELLQEAKYYITEDKVGVIIETVYAVGSYMIVETDAQNMFNNSFVEKKLYLSE